MTPAEGPAAYTSVGPSGPLTRGVGASARLGQIVKPSKRSTTTKRGVPACQ